MNKLYRAIIILMLIGAVACSEDFITRSDPDQVTDEFVLSDLSQVKAALNGVYDGLQTANYYGRYFVLLPDLMGDGVRQNPDNSNRGTLQYRYELNTNSGEAQGIWQDAYDVINRANLIIHALPDLEGSDGEKNQILGEAYALRALSHFDLVRFFSQPYNIAAGVTDANGEGGHIGVPIITEPLTPDQFRPRNTVSDVYAQVIADLELAKSLMNDAANFSQYSLTSAGASALLSRVYLYQEEWAKAEAEATTVINNASYELLTAGEYVAAFDGNVASSEAIFDLQFSTTDYNITNQLGYMYAQTGYYDMLPTTDLDDVLAAISDPATDVRANMWDTSVPVALKYLGPENSAGVDNTHILRLSEIYLIRAEARVQQGNATGGRADLNTLRSNRGAPDTSASDADLLDAILDERRIELAFEGHRLFDLTRNARDLVRIDCTLPNGNCVVPFPDHRFVHPIPQVEIDVNPNMIQNEGYQ